MRRSRHSFWNHPRRAQSGLQDISRTLLRVDLICRHDVSGGGNFSHQVSIRGWSSCVRWEGKQTETRGVHTLFARRLGHNHDFGCSLPAVRWPLVLNTFYILHNSPQHPCPAHSDTLRTLTTRLRPHSARCSLAVSVHPGAPWAQAGPRLGPGQSPVVNILITTSALQNCCHHSRTQWRGQSQQLSAGLWFDFMDALADLFMHHRRMGQPPHSPQLPTHSHFTCIPLSPRQVRCCAA